VFRPSLGLCHTSLLAAAVLLGSIAGCQSSAPAEPEPAASSTAAAGPPLRVTAGRPLRKTLRRESVQPGTIVAFEHTPLWAKLPAYVQKLYVDIGDRVEAGKLLADLWIPELEDELHQKEAQVLQARAGIEQAAAALQAAEAAVATAQAKISEAEAGKIRAEGDYARWTSQYARIRDLVSGGSLDRKLEDETRDSLKAAEAARGEAAAKVESAKASLVEKKADVVKAKADQSLARARLQSAEADLARQKALLQYAQIRAPYAGVVTERNVVRGDFVQPPTGAMAKPLLAVARTDVVRIFVDVPEMDSPWVEPGRAAQVAVQALPDRIVEGTVTRTSWVLGANRTLHTELDFPNPDGILRPGMYATAHVVLQERPHALVLPRSAVAGSGKQALCWTVRDSKAVKTPIALGLQVGDEVEVVSGLKGDELVVQSPAGSLQEGQPVEVTGS
jgi:HlyD family secretion protein